MAKEPIVVLVCGGRDFSEPEIINSVLDGLHRAQPIGLLVQGGAQGADWCAMTWAVQRGIDVATFPALWGFYGKSAGRRRNAVMAKYIKYDLCVVFPGGGGTADMVRKAKAAKVPIMRVKVEDA